MVLPSVILISIFEYIPYHELVETEDLLELPTLKNQEKYSDVILRRSPNTIEWATKNGHKTLEWWWDANTTLVSPITIAKCIDIAIDYQDVHSFGMLFLDQYTKGLERLIILVQEQIEDFCLQGSVRGLQILYKWYKSRYPLDTFPVSRRAIRRCNIPCLNWMDRKNLLFPCSGSLEGASLRGDLSVLNWWKRKGIHWMRWRPEIIRRSKYPRIHEFWAQIEREMNF